MGFVSSPIFVIKSCQQLVVIRFVGHAGEVCLLCHLLNPVLISLFSCTNWYDVFYGFKSSCIFSNYSLIFSLLQIALFRLVYTFALLIFDFFLFV